MTDPDNVRFIRLRLTSAYDWLDGDGRQVLALELLECLAALDELAADLASLVAERDEARAALREARRPITPMEGDAV